MFEITYKDKERLNEYIENRKAYPNAVYDFTFENRFLVYHCEMTNELHYIALDMETGCGSEMCRRKKNSPIPAESFNSLIPSIFQSIKYTGSVRHLNPMDVDPIELIDSIFRVVLPKYGYAVREEQIRLAKQMFKGLTNDLVSINEAEVGTGKTLAFLVAALVASKTNRDGISKPITITTANIELQTALVEKEIPKLSQCLMDYNIISRPLGNGSKNITVRSYQRSFELLLQKQKIPHHGFHALRHTFATRAIECGMDVKSLSEILGHKNPTITLKRYVHSFMEHKREFMNRLGKLL